MKYKKLREIYIQNKVSELEILEVISWVEAYQLYLSENELIENVKSMKTYIQTLIRTKDNSLDRLIALSRYCYSESKYDLYIYFTSILGSNGVVGEIKKRMIKEIGQKRTNDVFYDIIEPALGESIDKLSDFTSRWMVSIKEKLSKDEMIKVLAGNNHQVPMSVMMKEKDFYLKSKNFDEYLLERHKRKVSDLKNYMHENKVWFEQMITPEVITFVESNPEILSGVRKGNKLFVTKIPYNVNGFLEAKDERDKRFHVCHCPFARSSILNRNEVDSDWCYCSGGFAKFPFEIIFDRDLEIELLDSPLKGDMSCRFLITLPEDIL